MSGVGENGLGDKDVNEDGEKRNKTGLDWFLDGGALIYKAIVWVLKAIFEQIIVEIVYRSVIWVFRLFLKAMAAVFRAIID